MAVVPPQSITDQITDQKTPYCGELRYAVSNDSRMLAVTQRRGKEHNTGLGYQINFKCIVYNTDL